MTARSTGFTLTFGELRKMIEIAAQTTPDDTPVIIGPACASARNTSAYTAITHWAKTGEKGVTIPHADHKNNKWFNASRAEDWSEPYTIFHIR